MTTATIPASTRAVAVSRSRSMWSITAMSPGRSRESTVDVGFPTRAVPVTLGVASDALRALNFISGPVSQGEGAGGRRDLEQLAGGASAESDSAIPASIRDSSRSRAGPSRTVRPELVTDPSLAFSTSTWWSA